MIDIDKIASYTDLNEFEPNHAVEILGTIFEISREQNNLHLLKIGLTLSEKQNMGNFRDQDKMLFYYNLANGWSYHQKLTQSLNSDQFWAFDSIDLDNQILNLRLALKYSQTVNDNFNKCQILTNLGILFSHLGRFSEAQLYWNKAISLIPNFPMAIGNIGFGLFHYSKVLYDTGHQGIFLKIAYKYLSNSLSLDIYDEAKQSFKNLKNYIESFVNIDYLLEPLNLREFKLGRSLKERKYRTWCLNNRLFINPLNDVLTESIASNDVLFLPTMVLPFDKTPVFQSIFNQIKQEYVSTRFLMFEGLFEKRLHFSDRHNLQMDTLDYSSYSLSIEKIKIAFRICYSIFDKIGYLLNDYLKLEIPPDKVTFRKVWFVFDGKNSKVLNPKISENPNWAFRGLYWLSKDLYEDDFVTLIEPDGQDLAYIRNFVEHKSFKTLEFGPSGLTDDKLSYAISRTEFEIKTQKLFSLVRAAIIYLSLGINLEEKRKNNKDQPVIPVDFINFEDRFKK